MAWVKFGDFSFTKGSTIDHRVSFKSVVAVPKTIQEIEILGSISHPEPTLVISFVNEEKGKEFVKNLQDLGVAIELANFTNLLLFECIKKEQIFEVLRHLIKIEPSLINILPNFKGKYCLGNFY